VLCRPSAPSALVLVILSAKVVNGDAYLLTTLINALAFHSRHIHGREPSTLNALQPVTLHQLLRGMKRFIYRLRECYVDNDARFFEIYPPP